MNTTIETASPTLQSRDQHQPLTERRLLTPALSSAEEEREKQRRNREAERLSDKIARLPKATRDMINVMLEDGLPYHVLIEELGEAGQGLNARHVADWVQGRYQNYLKDREQMDHAKARMEFVSDLLRELGNADPDLIYRACRVVVALQMFDVILEHGDTALRNMLKRNPASYINLMNALCNLTNSALKCEEMRRKAE